MSILGINRADFHALINQILSNGQALRFQASGESMFPFIHDGDVLEISPHSSNAIWRGCVLLVDCGGGRLLVHRVIKTRRAGGLASVLIKGDNCVVPDGWFKDEAILGRVEIIQRGSRQKNLQSASQRLKAWIWVSIQDLLPYGSWLPGSLRRVIREWLSAV